MIRAHMLDRLEWTGETPRSGRARRRAFLATFGGSLRAVAMRVGFHHLCTHRRRVVHEIAGSRRLPLGGHPQRRLPGPPRDLPGPDRLRGRPLVCAVRRRWTVATPGEVLSSPIRNRAVRAGLVLTGVWIAFALLAPVILPSEQRTLEWGSRYGAPMWAPPFGTCEGAFPPCPAGEHHFWLLGTDKQGISNLAIAWEDRARLGSVAWVTAFGRRGRGSDRDARRREPSRTGLGVGMAGGRGGPPSRSCWHSSRCWWSRAATTRRRWRSR